MKGRFQAHAALATLGVIACRPELEDDYFLVESPRVLAVKSEPAEARPGTRLTFSAFLSVLGTASELPVWNFCTAPKPASENNAVSKACLGSGSLVSAGSGLSIEAETPREGCSSFGPNSPAGGFRPRDPDITGGYYQPLRLDLAGSQPTFHLQRISCDLADAASDTASEFARSYALNQNPHLEPLAASILGVPVPLAQIPAGSTVALTISWPASDVESYAFYDRAQQVLTRRREAMRVSWYSNAGSLDTESTGREEDDWQPSTQNHWTAPEAPGEFALWIVLRDSRGGVDFAAYALEVQR